MKHFISFLILFTSFIAQSQNVVLRKPYIQKMAADQATIHWRTLVPGTASVKYGKNQQALNLEQVGSLGLIDHSVTLNNLEPSTTYYYQILVNDSVLEGTNFQYFTTAPSLGSKNNLHFWVIGDAGTGNAQQNKVLQSYLDYPDKVNPNLVLMLGDNAYYTGLDIEYTTNLYSVYEDLYSQVAFFTVFGNHDSYSTNPLTETGAYFSNFDIPTEGELGGEPSGTEAYYSFDYANVHFISLDGNMVQDLLHPGEMAVWLEKDLQQNTQDWTIAMWHHPPYTKGSHDSDSEAELIYMREIINPLLDEYGVDLGLGGHSHNYERTYLIKGHYGDSDSFNEAKHVVDNGGNLNNRFTKTNDEGIVYVVAGTAGGQLGGGTMDHEAMVTSTDSIGSFLLDIVGDEMHGRFLSGNGQILDEFFIKKPSVSGVNENAFGANRMKVISAAYQNTLRLTYYLPQSMKGSFEVYDLNGRLVASKNVNEKSGQHTIDIPSKLFSGGVYVIQLVSENKLVLDYTKAQILR